MQLELLFPRNHRPIRVPVRILSSSNNHPLIARLFELALDKILFDRVDELLDIELEVLFLDHVVVIS